MGPTVEIKPEHHFTSKSYTSGSRISGHVVILSDHDLPFDEFDVSFVGVSQKRLELAHLYTGNVSDWMFLRQKMPINQGCLPEPNIFKAQQKYLVPFDFVIPRRLPTDKCDHPCTDATVQDHHLRLPPTMGFWGLDDMCPDMASIGYYISAQAFSKQSSSSRRSTVAVGQLMLKVLPAAPEEAPLDITSTDDQFATSREQTIRRGILSYKAGCLNIAASQPRAVMLSADGYRCSKTSVHITLQFTPYSDQNQPPRARAVSGKVISNTYFGPSMLQRWPHLGNRMSSKGSPIMNYSIATPIFDECLGELKWRRKSGNPGENSQHLPSLSTVSTAGERSSSIENEAPSTKYMAEIHVPFSIPHADKRIFLPTFHTCHFSRTYSLELNISTGIGVRPTRLSVPLQIGVEEMHKPWGDVDLVEFDELGLRTPESADTLPLYEDSIR